MKRRAPPRLAFRVERFLTRGIHTKVAALGALLVLVSLGAGVLAWLAPGGGFAHLHEAMWWAFLHLSDSGYLGDDRPTLRMLAIVLTVLGLVLFVGTLVAIITQTFVAWMERLALGLTPVSFSGHVAVLGWTNRTLELVAALLEDREDPPPVAVLVEEITPELERSLRDRFSRSVRSRLVLRTGDPESIDGLLRVCGRGPESIVVPGADLVGVNSGAADPRTLKIIASLDRVIGGADLPPRVVAEIADPRLLPIAQAAYRGPIQLIPSDVVVGRSLALGILSPGLALTLSEILDVRSGCALRVEQHTELAGGTIAAASRRLRNAVVLGALNPQGRVVAGLDARLQPEDEIFMLAPVGAPLEPARSEGSGSQSPASGDGQANTISTHNILVLGWSGKVPDLCWELGRRPDMRCQVDIVSRKEVSEREMGRSDGPALSLRHVVASPASPDAFEALDLAAYDRIVVVGDVEASDALEADSRTIATVLLVLHRLQDRETRPHVIAELLDPANRPVLEGRGVELVVTPDLAAGALAGAVTHPELGGIFAGMLAGRFGLPGVVSLDALAGHTTFGEIEKRLHRDGLVSIGLQREANGFALELVPDKSDALTVGENDLAVFVRPLDP